MSVKVNNGWKCNVCGELYPREQWALSCELSHEIIYVPIHQGDLFRLIQFLFTKDDKLLTDSLMSTLMKYSRKIGK